ncbi:helix-turn-helix domain-containing protein [Tautonia sp. JC769]|uniref:helix-turn-helix domain-containing protein n=1 Tax=Tautonia sp. JC769 TaxID=3232135 RepID=UPI00345B19FE
MTHHKKGRSTNRGGRPSIYTPGRLVSLFRGIAEGLTRDEAAEAAGISKRTLQRWIKSGRAGDPRFADLAEAVVTAERLAGWGREIAPIALKLLKRGII